MARSRKKLIVAAVAFANTPQGKRMIQQAREYLSRPETRQKALELIGEIRSRSVQKSSKSGPGTTGTSGPATSGPVTYHPPRKP